MKIGYMRISKGEQTTALQEDALASAQCEKTFCDVMSGAKDERPQFLEMLKFARSGDTIVVWRLDRLGRTNRPARAASPGRPASPSRRAAPRARASPSRRTSPRVSAGPRTPSHR